MGGARRRWADVGWDEEEVSGRTRRGRTADDEGWVSAGTALLSSAVATVAAAMWYLTALPWPLVLAVALVATAVGAASAVHAWRHRVREVAPLLVVLSFATGGPIMVSRIVLALVLGVAGPAA